MMTARTVYEAVLEEIYECAVRWLSADADNPDTPPLHWQQTYQRAKAAGVLLDACKTMVQYGMKGATPDGRWTMDVIRAAIAEAETT